jgi:hypothetical protein
VNELITITSQEKKLLQRHRRCEIELQDGFIPVNCYKWIHQLRRSPQQHQLLMSWLDQSCKDSIAQNLRSPEYALQDLNVLGAGCRLALKSWSEEWLYKTSREDKHKFMAKISEKFGKEIVIPDQDGTRPVANDNKLSAHRTYRRRLN